MKRTLAMILALVMLLGMLPMGVFADETTDFKLYFETDVTDVSALEIGDKITVTAYLANNPGFAGMKTKLTWDNSVVQFDGFTTETFRNQEYLVSNVIGDATYNQDKGTVVVGETDNLTASGKLWEAVFTVLKDGDTRIALSTDGSDFQLINAATEDLVSAVTIDQSALDSLVVPTHIHDYTQTEVVAPTCTEGGYTKHTCACGDSYTDTATSAAGHKYVDGICSVCTAPGTIIPEGAPFSDMLTSDGQIVTITAMGTEPVSGMGPLYKVEVPLGTTQVNVTYPEDAVALTNFGYSANLMIGFANVSEDGYGATKKDGKITVGLAMEKAAANGSTTTIKLINVPYGEEPRSVGFYDANGNVTHFLAFTYKLGNGQHFAALPEGIGYTVTGSPIASDGYTFQVTIEDGYEATSDFAVKVNGNTVSTEAGSISVPSVTEDLDITVEGVAKIVDTTTDISVTYDLTGYTGAIDANMIYFTKLGESNEVVVEAGKSATLSLLASENSHFGVYGYNVSPLVIGWEINGTAYYYPNEYTTYSLASGVSMAMNTDGSFNISITSTSPYQAVVKPIVGTSESLGAAPDFVEPGTIDVTDITVVGADVVSSTWEGDTLNVILAEDTALDAALKTIWTIYANNTKEGASQPLFNINGSLQTPSPAEATFTWDYGTTLEDGTATETYAFEVANVSWQPASQLEFTDKTFTINFYVSGKEPAPTYTVSIDEVITGGTVTADPASAEEGAEITLTVTPDTGYVLKTLTVTDASGTEVTVTDNKFTMPASNVTVSAVFEEEASEPESSLPFTITVDGKEVIAVADGTESCTIGYSETAPVYVVTVPAGTQSVTITNDINFELYKGEYELVAQYVTSADVAISEDTSYHFNDVFYEFEAHLYFEYEKAAPSYKSEYGITVLVGDEEMDLVDNGTEACGPMMTAQKLNITVPAGTTEVKFLNITDTVLYGQMYVYSGAHNWTEYASNVTEATISLANCGTSFCVSDSANAWYHVNITVEEPEIETNPITKIEVSHPNIVTDETTGALSMTVYPGASKNLDMSFTVANAQLEATQIVFWSSGNTDVAEVDQNGKITAKAAGTAIITAKAVDASGVAAAAEGDEVQVSIEITVPDVDNTEEQTYTLQMPGDSAVTVGETVSIPVMVGHTGDISIFNSYDITVSYDTSLLKLTSTEIEGATVTAGEGNVNVKRYGADLSVDSAAFTLTFKALDSGTAEVEVTEGYVSESATALDKDADEAQILNDITVIKITGYTVTLPEDFKGDATVESGKDYTFEAKDKNYSYTVKATIGGEEIPVTDNGDGTYTIAAKDITGNIVVTGEKNGKEVTVTLGDDMTGETKAYYMTDYTATLNKAEGYNYTVEVTIGGGKYKGFSYDTQTGLITIPGEAITGAIVFNTNKTAKTQDKHSVTIGGNSGVVTGEQEATNGQDYTFTIDKEVGYTYTVTATMGGEDVEVIDNGDGTYTIKNVTGDLVITVTKTYDMEVEVNQYVTLNGKTMFLVTAKATVDEGYALSYAESTMFYSEVYGAWSYLVITDSTLTVEEAKAQITLVKADKIALTATNDVNESGKVDINDAQLVFDMYNNEYQNFETASMQKFLKADVSGDKKIDVNDAVAIVTAILAAK